MSTNTAQSRQSQAFQTPICEPDLSSRPLQFMIEREMKRPPRTLYRAWTEQLDRWFAAPGSVLMRAEVNAPFFWEVRFGPTRHPHYGRFLRLEPDRLIQLTWVTGPTGTKGSETVVTLEFEPQGQGAYLKLTHAGFPDEETRKAHQNGWIRLLEELDEFTPGRA